jgi:UDP-N-acetylmuramoylalanine--D-glutamate ligase
MKISNLKNKNIAIWGFGKEAHAIIEILEKEYKNPKITIINKQKIENTKYPVLLENEIKNNFKAWDVIIKSPGVSIYKEEYKLLKKAGILITTLSNIFFKEVENKNVKTIGITGTKGKSTTTSMLHHTLKSLGYKTELAGNIGTPFNYNLIKNAAHLDYIICELSSYQIADLENFPEIAICLNLHPEHITWHQTKENYFKDKLNLINNPKSKIKIVNTSIDPSLLQSQNLKYFNNTNGIYFKNQTFFDNKKKLFEINNNKILGSHNHENIAAVLTVLKAENIKLNLKIKTALESFEPLIHRLQIIREYDGKLFIDDSTSSAPKSTIAAINTFKNDNIFLILGGHDRSADFKDLIKEIKENKNITQIALIGETAHKLKELLKKENIKAIIKDLKTLKNTIDYVKDENNFKGVVLLSPASPSFDQYKNFYERGNHFIKLVNQIDKKNK